MTENLTITTERVDDIPLLLAQMKQMDLPHLFDSYFPIHGNWQGLDAGWTATMWLAHILSQADHRLSYVQPWAAGHLRTLQQASGHPVRALDFSDDRLASLLRYFSADQSWAGFEAALNRRLVRVYDLSATQVRLDSTTASGYWAVDDAGLFQLGHSKDKRPDLAQLKVMLASLDPLPLPLVTHVLPGYAADDPLYCPAIRAVRASLGRRGLLYVGDSKMAALATRTYLQAGGDFYLMPLPAPQLPADWQTAYLGPVHAATAPLRTVQRQRLDGDVGDIAVGYECTEAVRATYETQALQGPERRLVVRSLSAAKSAEQRLRKRLALAEAALRALNARGRGKKRPADRAALEHAIAAIGAQYHVEGLVRVDLSEHWHQRSVRAYKGRAGRSEQQWDFSLGVERDEAALQRTIAGLGWQVYATNRPSSELSLEQAVLCYREEYLIEQSFGRLKGAPLSVSPFYLHRDDHAKGLVRLLSVAVRVLALVECVVRRRLAADGAELAGLYAGQPQAGTRRPTTERLLESFRGVTLTLIQQADQVVLHVTPLSDLQRRILELLGFSVDIYRGLVLASMNPP
jgi:transposase